MITFNLRQEPEGETYRSLLRWAGRYCEELRFVTFDRWPMPPAAAEMTARLHPYFVGEEIVVGWTGTQLGPGWSARLWRYRVSPELIEAVLSFKTGLPDWGGYLPDDVHLMRADGSVFMATTSSEEDAWLELSDEEMADLRTIPDLYALGG
jgi:hypothetical protein